MTSFPSPYRVVYRTFPLNDLDLVLTSFLVQSLPTCITWAARNHYLIPDLECWRDCQLPVKVCVYGGCRLSVLLPSPLSLSLSLSPLPLLSHRSLHYILSHLFTVLKHEIV